jgi:hypothetical protein
MNRQIGLAISLEVVSLDGDPTGNRRLEDAGGDGLTLPLYFTRQADVDGYDSHKRSDLWWLRYVGM